ncbi:MAG TPA: SHOCT domain-containing protein, partial [Solirubrobacteraceae bacterium]|nr:SHOCT domain-containing protein [Solirubrobacteraceae bacterium]
GTEMLRRQTRREFPDARAGELRETLAARMQAMRERRHRPAAATAPTGNGFTDELERLAALRDAGSITPDEYETAKRRILGSPGDSGTPPPARSGAGS